MASARSGPSTASPTEYVCPLPTTCRVVGWDDLRPGDEMWYLIARKGRVNPDEPHGPFRVVDPARGRIRNTSGVELNFRSSNLVLLLPKNAVRPPRAAGEGDDGRQREAQAQA